MVGRTDADLFGPEDAGRLASLKRRVLETGEVLRQEVTVTPGGTRHILDLTLEPLRDADGEIVGISGMAVERAEEVCRPGTDTLNLMLRNARDIVYRIELAPVRRFSYISPAVTRIAGYAPKEVYADPEIALRFIHPDELPLLEAVFRGEFAPDRPLMLRWLRKDGTVIWVESQNVPIRDEKGLLSAIEGIARDVTERKQMEEALRESEERFRSIFNESPIGIEYYDAAGNLIDINPAALRIFGVLDRDKLAGRLRRAHPGYHRPGEGGHHAAAGLRADPAEHRTVRDPRGSCPPAPAGDPRHGGTLRGGKEMDIIRDQVDRINDIIRQPDIGWMEARKIRDFLQRHEPA